MASSSKPSIEDIIETAKAYARQGLREDEAIRKAITEMTAYRPTNYITAT